MLAGAASSTRAGALGTTAATITSRRPLAAFALPAIMLLGAANFVWQLGTSSLFVDEALSVQHSLEPLSNLVRDVRMFETTPWTYFIGLHEWMGRLGSHHDWVVRLPSVIAGVALVAAVYWMARAFLDERPALATAVLCALTPLVLQYAQQARVYVFAMLASTLAIGATAHGAKPEISRSGTNLLLGAMAAVLALWLHYTATFVIIPLCVWLALQRAVPPLARIAFIGACLVAQLLLLPLFIDQYNAAPNGGLGALAALKFSTATEVVGTPLNGRFAPSDALLMLGAVTLATSVLMVVAFRTRATPVREPLLLASLAALAPTVLILAGALGKDVVITRYSAVAAPMMLTALMAGVVSAPRPLALALALATSALTVIGLVRSHSRTGFYRPSREVIDYVRATPYSRTPIILPSDVSADIALEYYAAERLHPATGQLLTLRAPASIKALLRRRQPLIWIVAELPPGHYRSSRLVALTSRTLASFGYVPASVRAFTTSSTLAVYLARFNGSRTR